MATNLQKASYASFSTRKKDGSWVNTPLWFAPDGDKFYIFSAGNAGKVKRLRNFSDCKVATCTMSGTVTGEWLAATAWLINDAAEIAVANRALHRKYGWQMKLTDWGSKLTGKYNQRQLIGFRLTGDKE